MCPFPKLKTSAELPINWKDRQNKKFYLSIYLPTYHLLCGTEFEKVNSW